MRARIGPTVTQIPDPPPYCTLVSNGRIHLVRDLVEVRWPDGSSHRSISFWCYGMVLLGRGRLSSTRSYEGDDCRVCIRNTTTGQGRWSS